MRIVKNPEQRRQEILDAAFSLFEANGIYRTKISDITHRAGIAQGLFYYYFSSKERVIAAVYEMVIATVERAALSIIGDKRIRFSERLGRYVQLYLQTAQRLARCRRNEPPDARFAPMIASIETDIDQRTIGHLRLLISEGSQEGALQLRYPEEMLKMVFYGLRTLDWDVERDEDKILTMIEQGLHLPMGSMRESAQEAE